jgi:hypothetical protein
MNSKNSKINKIDKKDKLCFFKNPIFDKDKIEIFKFNKSKKIMTIIFHK